MAASIDAYVLIVNDDEDILELLVPILSSAGFRVAAARSAGAAMDILDHEAIDLMVTDVVLPGRINGVDLVRRARLRRPTIKSLFISGRVFPRLDDRDRDEFIQKPFRAYELLGSIFELLFREPISRGIVAENQAEQSTWTLKSALKSRRTSVVRRPEMIR